MVNSTIAMFEAGPGYSRRLDPDTKKNLSKRWIYKKTYQILWDVEFSLFIDVTAYNFLSINEEKNQRSYIFLSLFKLLYT